ncbi:C-type lectin domain 19 member A [Mactra antiquata]
MKMRNLHFLVFIQVLFTATSFLFDEGYSGETHHEHQGLGTLTHTLGNRQLEFVFDKFLNWDDASYVCHYKGGHLVKVPDFQTQDFIMSVLHSVQYAEESIWIGLHDKIQEGLWKWDGGDDLKGYTNFGYGENNHGFLHMGTDCVCIELDDHGYWHDKQCHGWFKYNFICEYSNFFNKILRRFQHITGHVTAASSPTQLSWLIF